MRGVDTGGGKPVIDGKYNAGRIITISINESVIEGFKIINSGEGIVVFSNKNIIKNNDISNISTGIWLENSNNELSDNYIYYGSSSGSGIGIHLAGASYSNISNNKIVDFERGIRLYGKRSNNKIRNNIISKNR